jgi:hypothetical protein
MTQLAPSVHTHLPREERHIDCVQRDVHVACVVVALLHGWHQRSSQSPEHHNASASKQVGAWEQLACAHPGVDRALDTDEHTSSQQPAANVVVLVPEATLHQLLALLQAANAGHKK